MELSLVQGLEVEDAQRNDWQATKRRSEAQVLDRWPHQIKPI